MSYSMNYNWFNFSIFKLITIIFNIVKKCPGEFVSHHPSQLGLFNLLLGCCAPVTMAILKPGTQLLRKSGIHIPFDLHFLSWSRIPKNSHLKSGIGRILNGPQEFSPPLCTCLHNTQNCELNEVTTLVILLFDTVDFVLRLSRWT